MNDRKGRTPAPTVEVIRRPTLSSPGGADRPPTPVRGSGFGPRPGPRSGPPSGGRGGPRRPPPTPDQVEALARRDHVPLRIAKGDLEGKMKTRIWRKLHAEEARRFDQAYQLMEKHPGLALQDAFALLQSGRSIEDLQARRSRTQRRAAVKEARGQVPGEVVDKLLERWIREKVELSFVLGERTVFDVLEGTHSVSLGLGRSGALEKLQIVIIAPRPLWERQAPHLERDPKLSQKPQAVTREPDKRPYSDPRPFLPAVGKPVRVLLRNGIRLEAPLAAVGPYDLLLGTEPGTTDEVQLVPIHALVQFEVAEPSPPTHPEADGAAR